MIKALKGIKPSVSKKDVKDCENWKDKYGCEGS